MNHLGILLKYILGQAWDCLSKKFPDDAGVAGKKKMLWPNSQNLEYTQGRFLNLEEVKDNQ